MFWYKIFLRLIITGILLLSSLKYAISQAIRISYNEYKITIPLVEIKDKKFCTLLDTVLFYQKKCIFAQKGIYTGRIDLFKHSIDEKLLVEYMGFPFEDYTIEYVPPQSCIIYKNSLFLVYMEIKSNQEDIGEWMNNQFDKLFIKSDTTYTWIYDLNDFGRVFKSKYEYDGLTIRFLEEENSYKTLFQKACIENKSDIYIPPKEKKISDRRIHRKIKKLERKHLQYNK